MERSEHAAVTMPFRCLMWKLGFRKVTLRRNFRPFAFFATTETATPEAATAEADAAGTVSAAVRDKKKWSLAVDSVVDFASVCGRINDGKERRFCVPESDGSRHDGSHACCVPG